MILMPMCRGVAVGIDATMVARPCPSQMMPILCITPSLPNLVVSCAHGHGFGQPPPSWCPLDAYRRADQGIVGARALPRSHAGTRPLAYLGAPHPVFYAGIDEQKAPPGRRVPSPALWRPRSWSRPWHPPCARPRGALPGTVPGARLVTAVGIGAAMVARPCPSLGTRGPCMSPHWAKLAVSAAHGHGHEQHGSGRLEGATQLCPSWDSFFQKRDSFFPKKACIH